MLKDFTSQHPQGHEADTKSWKARGLDVYFKTLKVEACYGTPVFAGCAGSLMFANIVSKFIVLIMHYIA